MSTRLSKSEFLKIADELGARQRAGEDISADALAAVKKLTGRECGECSLCCKILDIDELSKPAGKWCQHCRPGSGGCSIYQARPAVCRGFTCGWMMRSDLGEEWKPSRSKIVIHIKAEADGSASWNFIVDPACPDRWREPRYHGVIQECAFNGLNGVNGNYFHTHVKTRRRNILVVPGKEVDVTDQYFLVTKVGDAWQVRTFASAADGQRFVDAMATQTMVRPHQTVCR